MNSRTQVSQSRTEVIRKSLVDFCEALGPGGKLPTVRALSSELAASTSTLDRVMADLEREGRIVRRHGSGVFVATPKKSNAIALVSGVDPFAVGQSPFYPIVGDLIRKGVLDSGRDFKFYLDPHFEKHGMLSRMDFLNDLKDGALLGAVFMATAHPDIFTQMNELGFPYVGLTDSPLSIRRYYVDSPSLVDLGVEKLAQSGCKRLCLLTWDGFGSQVEECHGNFKRALLRNGLPLLDGAIWTRKEIRSDDEVIPRQHFGSLAAKSFFRLDSKLFDGMLCTDDMLCSGALSSLRDFSVSPGDGLLVATHANRGSPVLALAGRGVIKLEVDTQALAADVLGALEELIGGKAVEPFVRTAKVEVVR